MVAKINSCKMFKVSVFHMVYAQWLIFLMHKPGGKYPCFKTRWQWLTLHKCLLTARHYVTFFMSSISFKSQNSCFTEEIIWRNFNDTVPNRQTTHSRYLLNGNSFNHYLKLKSISVILFSLFLSQNLGLMLSTVSGGRTKVVLIKIWC